MTEIANIDWFGRLGTYVFSDNTAVLVLPGLIWTRTFVFEPRHEKTCLRVCDQVRLKPACAANWRSHRD